MEEFDRFLEEYTKIQEINFKKAVENMVDVNKYVKIHKHYYYCEVIITKEGLIAEAHPSHTEFLKRYSGLTDEQILELDKDMMSTPLDILLEHTECVAIWYEDYRYKGTLSKEQQEAIDTLIENKIVGFKIKEGVI